MRIAKVLFVCAVFFGALMSVAHGQEESDGTCDFQLTHTCKDGLQQLVINTIEENITEIIPRGCSDNIIIPDLDKEEYSFEVSMECNIEFKYYDGEVCTVASVCEDDDDDDNNIVGIAVGVGCAALVIIIVVVIVIVVVCSSGKHNSEVFDDDGSSFSISDDDSNDDDDYSSSGGFSDGDD